MPDECVGRTYRRGCRMGVDVADVSGRGTRMCQGPRHTQRRRTQSRRRGRHNMVRVSRHAIPSHLHGPQEGGFSCRATLVDVRIFPGQNSARNLYLV